MERLERFSDLLPAGGLTIELVGSTPVPETEYSKPVRKLSERMLSLTMVFVSVCDETIPWLKFGMTGTAAAGDATSNSNALAALEFTDHLSDCTGVRSARGDRNCSSRGHRSAQASVGPSGRAGHIAKCGHLANCRG